MCCPARECTRQAKKKNKVPKHEVEKDGARVVDEIPSSQREGRRAMCCDQAHYAAHRGATGHLGKPKSVTMSMLIRRADQHDDATAQLIAIAS